MTNYRRSAYSGGYYFFTIVTYDRREFLTQPLARNCLREAFIKTREKQPFSMIAICLLPNHLHCVWQLPDNDGDYSMRWARIKSGFTRSYLRSGGIETAQSPSRQAKRQRGIWQRRFWEHRIRDEQDLQNHIDYVHYNPVRHLLVKSMDDWPWSTYHRYEREKMGRGSIGMSIKENELW